MTWPAALPGAALRAMRTAAGWRAVRLALLVGAVFALGVLCGERAQAADGGPAGGTSSALTSTVPSGTGASPLGALTGPRPDVVGPLRPLTGTVVRPVRQGVVRQVGELVDAVTAPLGEAAPGQLPGTPDLPDLPVPEESGPLPEVPVLPDVPERTLPDPDASAPRPGAPTAPPSGVSGQDARHAQDAPAEPKAPDRSVASEGPVLHGPAPVRSGDSAHGEHGHRTARGAVRAGPAPAPDAPADQPDGSGGNRPAADHGKQRHGDACAVTAHHRPPLRLVPGTTVPAEATGTRDPYRDVPVSPA
ncbi:hypothetical protein ACH4CD_28070 [Streptomyces fungicidicus]|uniref:hypothetical protein n=1 Tax=Streptomyces fungicidicus TaxID=68203 RepID=UPI00379E2D3E